MYFTHELISVAAMFQSNMTHMSSICSDCFEVEKVHRQQKAIRRGSSRKRNPALAESPAFLPTSFGDQHKFPQPRSLQVNQDSLELIFPRIFRWTIQCTCQGSDDEPQRYRQSRSRTCSDPFEGSMHQTRQNTKHVLSTLGETGPIMVSFEKQQLALLH